MKKEPSDYPREKNKLSYEKSNALLKQLHTERMRRELESTSQHHEKCISLFEGNFHLKFRELPSSVGVGGYLWKGETILCEYLHHHLDLYESSSSALELGSGCIGMSALLCAVRMKKPKLIVLTDTDNVLSLLRENVQRNQDLFLTKGIDKAKIVKVEELLWGNDEHIKKIVGINQNKAYDLILGADVVYHKDSIPSLLYTLHVLFHLPDARKKTKFLLSYKERDRQSEKALFFDQLQSHSLQFKEVYSQKLDPLLNLTSNIQYIYLITRI